MVVGQPMTGPAQHVAPSQELHCNGLARSPKPLVDMEVGAVISHFAENM